MGGGLMQLVAYGAQDIYLTGNPQITFFKVVYRRHTNFSMECIQQTINGTPSSGGNSTVTISRNGDLVYKIYVTNDNTGVTDGSQMVSEVELEIGGQRIDRHYQEWMDVWNELSTPESKAIGLKSMQGAVSDQVASGVDMVQVPLQFWFCRNPGLALPLIALQYHEVKLKFTWGTTAGDVTGCKVFADYIYLDTDERRRFAQVSHEYLIEQLQKQTSGGSTSEKLNFNHPVKELIWTNQAAADYDTAILKLNGHDRFSAQQSEYFQLRQPFDYHTAVPRQNLPVVSKKLVSSGANNLTGVTYVAGATSGSSADHTLLASQLASGVVTVTKHSLGGAPAVMNSATTAATGVVYGFRTTDLAVDALSAGDLVLITGSGASFLGGNPGVLIAEVTACQVADGTDGHADNTLVQFKSRIENLAAESGANAVVIQSISKITNTNDARTSQMLKKINVYSFGLKPEEHQPSGTCNFSRIDNAKLDFTGTQPDTNQAIYAVNYNVLRIMSGMGGLAYSN